MACKILGLWNITGPLCTLLVTSELENYGLSYTISMLASNCMLVVRVCDVTSGCQLAREGGIWYDGMGPVYRFAMQLSHRPHYNCQCTH